VTKNNIGGAHHDFFLKSILFWSRLTRTIHFFGCILVQLFGIEPVIHNGWIQQAQRQYQGGSAASIGDYHCDTVVDTHLGVGRGLGGHPVTADPKKSTDCAAKTCVQQQQS